MSQDNWAIIVAVVGLGVIMLMRLDRLGKQVEAISAMIRMDVARTEEDRDDILNEWKETKRQGPKPDRAGQ